MPNTTTPKDNTDHTSNTLKNSLHTNLQQTLSNQTNNKKVGIVIPIYNVAPYLRECLDSVINQTYTNLSILLVNDGSTDNESLAIAQEYTKHDTRITLIDKQNGGQASARNVGIEWFAKKYQLKAQQETSIQTTHDLIQNNTLENNNTNSFNNIFPNTSNDLRIFIPINGNPYNIYGVYKSDNFFNKKNLKEEIINDYNNFTSDTIDYIIFLDSDDYWKLNCIEECIKHADGVEVVWFDYEYFYDGIEAPGEKWKTWQELYNYTENSKKSYEEWIQKVVDEKSGFFAVVCGTFINFTFLQNIKLFFLTNVIHEDALFQLLLFAQTQYIYVLNEKFYIYRIREGSTTDYKTSKKTKPTLPPYLQPICAHFQNNINYTKGYHVASSWFLMTLEILKFLEQNKNKNRTALIQQAFLPHFCTMSLDIANYPEDPLNLLPQLSQLQPYAHMIKLKRFKKIALLSPNKYKFYIPLIKLYRWFRRLERDIRIMIKSKKI